tara:strand:+ start:148 stop:339 length:192 start_codon:yes stop_codon:yes gene_type:complete
LVKEEEENSLSGIEIIDSVELHKIIVDMHYYENKYAQIKKQNRRLTKEVVRLAKIVNDYKKRD